MHKPTSNSILFKDIELKFPQFVVLKASAGSGKTHALARRFVQFILSEKVPKNDLRNILAITFTNNAAKEMKERIIKTLKELYFNKSEIIDDFTNLVSLNRDQISLKAGKLVDEILDRYSDFNVKTIDSFMTSIFKASAIDLSFNTNFEIVMEHESIIDYAFNIYLKRVTKGSDEAKIITKIIDIIHENRSEDSSFLWNPVPKLLEEIKRIYRKVILLGKQTEIKDYSYAIKQKKEKIRNILEEIRLKIDGSSLEIKDKTPFHKILNLAQNDRFIDLIEIGISKPPVKRPKNKSLEGHYLKIEELWQDFKKLVEEYVDLFSCSYYTPYLKVYNEFSDIVEKTKRYRGKIFIGDINNYLSMYIDNYIVPDIYFRIGETIYHFLIDEFQDTSPLQWKNLLPLVSNSLSQGGSLFIVGDTKQAIYSFRDADYKIMKKYESFNPFPSAHYYIKELYMNYRSLDEILSFNEKVFKEMAIQNPKYAEPTMRSGLCDYIQKAKDASKPGYVELIIFDESREIFPERERLIGIIEDVIKRGYNYSDIAILTSKNKDVVTISEWLCERNIDFVSFSSLDVRRRKITKELISLINFLDSPIDDLSFATFITGEIFIENLRQQGLQDPTRTIHDFLLASIQMRPLYKIFQDKFPDLWEIFFEELFQLVGYLPLYELTDRIMKKFDIFNLKADEEASLVKILELIKDFEASGYNNIKDFLALTEEDYSYVNSKWDIPLPARINAVKVMTIHQAKGLGFPIVITLLYEERNKGFQYLIDESENSIRLLRITQKIAKNNERLYQIYREERINEIVNKLNTLYVGFTRSEKELYIIGLKRGGRSYPFDLITLNGYLSGQKTFRDLISTEIISRDIDTYHHKKIFPLFVDYEKAINLYEKKRGEFIHKILSSITYLDETFEEELTQIIDRLYRKERAKYSQKEIGEIKKLIKKVIMDSPLREFFIAKAGRRVLNEMEIVSTTGRLFRIDRVVIDSDRSTIIEYKTGSDTDLINKYYSQVKNYMDLFVKIYSHKTVSGIIAFIDSQGVEIKEIK
ncbi:MAG: UvrD-helicase domain-containing protein [Thermodesulfovibrionales bacterium]|nr:UvrD-helicase domain-containing protein [Thermodesulfovibrionales bacterium]